MTWLTPVYNRAHTGNVSDTSTILRSSLETSVLAMSLVPEAKVPSDYRCSKCGLHGVKLWRNSHVFLDSVNVMCATCALANEGCPGPMDAQGRREVRYFVDAKTGAPFTETTDQIGTMVPAVPVVHRGAIETYWGYSSVPKVDVDWWVALPTKLE